MPLDAQQKQKLLENAKALLTANDTGEFIKPSTSQYPHIWNWDTAFIVIALSHYDIPQAKKEVDALLAGQWKTGLLPHILYPNGASDYFPTPDFWHTENLENGPPYPTSGLTQPPVLATAVKAIFDKDGDKDYLASVYPKLLDWHRWLYAARDPEGTGLVSIIHPWEAGTDNSPRFDEAMQNLTQNLKPENVPAFQRKDKNHVNPDERPRQEDYIRFMYLIGFYRERNWDDAVLYNEAPLLVQDILLNSIFYKANQDMLILAEELGEDTQEIQDWLDKSKAAFQTLWDEDAGMFFDKDMKQDKLLKISSIQALSPLMTNLSSEAQVKRMVAHLENPESFGSGDAPYMLPTIAKDEDYFEARRYWRGPIWINMNWFFWKALKEHGYTELAEKVKDHSLELIHKSDFVEYYDCRDGSACGAAGFSWSAALAIDMLMDA